MKTFALAAIAGLSTALMSTDDYEFMKYIAKHGKVYETVEEYGHRMNEWRKANDHIKAHNAEARTWTLGHNHMSDWTAEERKSLNGLKPELREREYAPVWLEPSNADGVNWVEKGAVTDVKNMGCNGGLMDKAFKYVESNALATEADYPYTSGQGKRGSCDTSKLANAALKVSTYTDVTKNDASQLKAALDKQPVSVAIEADKMAFQMYTSGVLTGTDCGTNLDHGVLAVGYGVENGTEYFLVKNSWGATWGDKGYIKLGVESSDAAGVCGILSGPPSYPETN